MGAIRHKNFKTSEQGGEIEIFHIFSIADFPKAQEVLLGKKQIEVKIHEDENQDIDESIGKFEDFFSNESCFVYLKSLEQSSNQGEYPKHHVGNVGEKIQVKLEFDNGIKKRSQ
jgi:hypothetical protein